VFIGYDTARAGGRECAGRFPSKALLKLPLLIGQVRLDQLGGIYDANTTPNRALILLLALSLRAVAGGLIRAGACSIDADIALPGGYRRALGPGVTSASQCNW